MGNNIENSQKVWHLKQLNLFEGIAESEIMEIAKEVQHLKCMKGEVLGTPFDIENKIYLLKKGEVNLYHSHQGKKIIIDTLNDGSIWGGVGDKKSDGSYFAEVVEDSFICIFEQESFLAIAAKKPQIMLNLLKIFSEKISNYEAKIKLNLLSASEKVAKALVDYKQKRQKSLLGKLGLKKLTHVRIAEQTGLSRETVSRAIQEIKTTNKAMACGKDWDWCNCDFYH